MGTAPGDQRHESPYPQTIDRRISDLEGWRGTVDEWRRGVDAWRNTIEREGIVTAVAVIGTKMDQTHEDIVSARREIGDVKADVREVKTELSNVKADVVAQANVRRGITLTGRTIVAVVAALAGASTILGLLIVLATGGSG